jgi:hypothetical protein
MPMWTCPFCGLATDVPHENQGTCLRALAAEITRMREILDRVQSAKVPSLPRLEDDEPDEPGSRY